MTEAQKLALAGMANVAVAVCGAQGHQIAVQEHPGRTLTEGGYDQEEAPGYEIRCTACGMTLEEIRKSGE